ncbi:MAG: hypothetical protein RJA10_4824, partial [Pseudomonadota bacterium]
TAGVGVGAGEVIGNSLKLLQF